MGRTKKQGATAPKTKARIPASYAGRMAYLKSKGVPFSWRSSAKLTPQRKAAITRKVRRFAEFLNPDNEFQFVPLKPSQVKAVRRNKEIARAQITTKGAFLPRVKGEKRTTFRVGKNGEIASKTGKFTSHFRLYSAIEVAQDPSIIERDGKKLRAESVFISIKGHRGGSRKNGFSLKNFMRYMSEQIIPDIEDAQEEDEIEQLNRGKKRTAFKNFVGVEFVTFDWSSVKSRKQQKKKGRK